MDKKRKLPPRGAGRSEAGSSKKSRTSTPPEQLRPPTPPPQLIEPEPLPTSITSGRPLPTLPYPQPKNLSSSQYQTVSESGVMAESLERSRKKFINEGIFERYWTKPTKKKGISNETPDNPPKDSMSKLGPCTLTIEPHVFDVVMYAIKDTSSRETLPLPQPMYRPIIQYGPQPQPQPSPAQAQFHHMQAGPQGARPQESFNSAYGGPAPPPGNGNGPPQIAPTHAPTHAPPPPVQNSQDHPREANPQPPQPSPATTPAAAPAAAPAPTESSPAPSKSSDPVIQLLAERAAEDVNLKALMRIVANGQASTDELRSFQGHIDELTRLTRARQPSTPTQQSSNHQPPPASDSSAKGRPTQPPAPNNMTNVRSTTPAAAQNHRPMQHLPLQHGTPNHQFPPQPQALRSKGPLPPTRPDISGVCFEFIGGSGDRFLFPKYSILEFGPPPGSVIASFLIVRKGSAADAPSYDPKLDYYQPMTVRLYAHQSRQLDNLQKVVAPQAEVRKYMDDIMDNMTRAEYVVLAMQLPREVERPEPEDIPMQNGYNNGNGVLWTTPATHPQAIAQRPPPLTEDQQYQNFVSSVS